MGSSRVEEVEVQGRELAASSSGISVARASGSIVGGFPRCVVDGRGGVSWLPQVTGSGVASSRFRFGVRVVVVVFPNSRPANWLRQELSGRGGLWLLLHAAHCLTGPPTMVAVSNRGDQPRDD